MLENIWPSILICMPTPSQHNWDIFSLLLLDVLLMS